MKVLITKAAALVLLWALCLCTVFWSVNVLLYSDFIGLAIYYESKLTNILLAILWNLSLFFALPISGWLADSRFGNFKVFRAGCVLIFQGSVMISVSILVANNLSKQISLITIEILSPISYFLLF